ncbi:MAG: hypothetical protein WC934_04940 [Acidithiobacillus sp.]|jgi:hypothetical protein|uniref:hypothetical protein n=1 Tax=Acidithiobacillus sp. TaxID=1872118 RepID=UPI00355D57A9
MTLIINQIKDQLQKFECFDINDMKLTLQNENFVEYQFIGKVDGKLSKIKHIIYNDENEKIDEKYKYSMTIHNPKNISDGEYFIIFKKSKNDYYYTILKDLKIFIKKIKSITSNNNLHEYDSYSCKFHVGYYHDTDVKISKDKYELYLYQKKVDIHNKHDIISYLSHLELFKNCFVDEVEIKQIKNNSSSSHTYYKKIIYINKRKNVPLGKNHIIIFNNPNQFILQYEKLMNNIIQNTSNTTNIIDSYLYKQLLPIILRYIKKSSQNQIKLHPLYQYYNTEQLIQNILPTLNENFWENIFQDLIEKYYPLTDQLQFKDIEKIRLKKYESIFFNNNINTEKLQLFCELHHLLPHIMVLIKSNYDWYILNDVIELIKFDNQYEILIQDSDKMTAIVSKIFKNLVLFELKMQGLSTFNEQKD